MILFINKRSVFYLIMLFVVFASYGCDSEQSNINRGHRYINRGKFDNAIENYTWALKENASNPKTYFFRGFAYMQKEDLDSALSDFSKAIDLDPTYANAYINRGTIRKKKGEIDKALQDYNKVIQLKPDDYRAYMVRADLWFQGGCFDNAMSDYRVAINNNHDTAVAHMGVADAYYQEHDYASATQYYQNSIQIKPDYSFAYNNLAWLLATCVEEKYRDGTQALEYAKKAVELDPSHINLHTYAVAHAENGMFDKAVSMLEEIMLKEKHDDFKKHLALFNDKKPLREEPFYKSVKLSSELKCK